MKISLNWIKEFTDVDLSIDELISKIGTQLGAVEEYEYIGDKYKGIVIVEVKECIKHQQADKLNVCRVDDGGYIKDVQRDDQGLIQVVCGAPNVRAGMLAVWIPPKATVPSTFNKDKIVLEARELRGIVSNGMLASPKELAFGDSHEGLLEIDTDIKPGTTLIDAYKLDDYVIDLENKMFTHRPDCFGILGIAREISGIQDIQFVSPKWYKENIESPIGNGTLALEVNNQAPELAPRFVAYSVSGVEIKPSPLFMQSMLSRIGIRPINNIVDITNYMMTLTGQPLHAYDYDKVTSKNDGRAEIIVRRGINDEKLTLLSGKEITLKESDIVIAIDDEAIGLAGVMGGATTEVDENTRNIILECANFNMYTIRRTSMDYGLFTDAVTRFTKGQSKRQNLAVALKTLEMIRELSGGQLASEIIDNNYTAQKISRVSISTDFINSRLGMKLTSEEIQRLLGNVELIVEKENDNFSIGESFWRTDIEIKEDIVEEVGRLNGYFKLPQDLPYRQIKPAMVGEQLQTASRIRDLLSAAGANEVLCHSFVHGDLLKKSHQDSSLAIEINNAISPDLQYYRLSITPSILELIYPNLRSDYSDSDNKSFALFEIGKSHNNQDKDEDNLPLENITLGLVFAADSKTAKRHFEGAAYYQAKEYLSYLLEKLGLPLQFLPLNNSKDYLKDDIWFKQLVEPYEDKRSALLVIGKEPVGVVGEFKNSVKTSLKLPDFTAGFELKLSALDNVNSETTYLPLPKFPKIHQDICLKVDAKITYDNLFNLIWDKIEASKPDKTSFDLKLVDIFQKEDDLDNKQITFRLTISAYDRTLTTESVNELLDGVASTLEKEISSSRI